MKKTKILIAAVLKPVTDTRMREKLGASLAKIPAAEVHLAGFPDFAEKRPGSQRSNAGILHSHPFSFFKRLSWGRVKVQLTYWRLLRQLKPAILLIGTPELLLVSVLYQLVAGGQIWYDVRENYWLNLTTQNTYPRLVGYCLGYAIRGLEYATSLFVAEYFLAEKSYAAQLPFIGRKYTVLENKYQPPFSVAASAGLLPRQLSPTQVKLLYSGTISEIYGIFEAIQLADDLHRLHPGFSLTIIGYCAVTTTLQKVRAAVRNKPYIKLIGGDRLVPHALILYHIQQSDLGLLPYRPHPSTWACTPTKLFEYLAHGLPVLVAANPDWHTYVERYQAGLRVDFSRIKAVELLPQLFAQRFYPSGIPTEVFWQTEEEKLLPLAQKYI